MKKILIVALFIISIENIYSSDDSAASIKAQAIFYAKKSVTITNQLLTARTPYENLSCRWPCCDCCIPLLDKNHRL